MKRCINRFGVTDLVSSSGKTPDALGEEILTKLVSWRRCGWQMGLALALGIGGAIAFSANGALAQSNILRDNTLGNENSVVLQNFNGLPVEVITGGAVRGQNLFHSFQEFNVSAGREAFFFSPNNTIQNILARVTGNNPSQILGILGTFGNSQPNLFLINPNGILFGPNAQLNLGGSFFASTASSVVFANGNQFSATNPQTPPLLTISVPLGLQYGSNPGSIQAQGSMLQVPNGQTLAFVGGNIQLNAASLLAPGGRVDLGGLSEPGTIGLNADSNNLRLSFPNGVARTDVTLTNGSRVNVIAGGGGSIGVNARNLNVSGLSGFGAGIGPGLGTVRSQAGNIEINATDTVTLDGTSSTISNSAIINAVLDFGTSGDIVIDTDTLNIIGNAQIGSFTNGQGNAGSVIIRARNSVSITGTNSGIGSLVAPFGTGNGAEINIKARSLFLSDSALISTGTLGQGNAGNIQVDVSDSVSINGGSLIQATTLGQGNAGNVKIKAGGEVALNGVGSLGNSSAIVSEVRPTGIPGFTGDRKGGDLNIQARSLTVTNGAQLSASTLARGNAGGIRIFAQDRVSFDGVGSNGRPSGAFSTVEQGAVGDGSNIEINTGSLSVKNGARLSTSTLSQGNAGAVKISATDTVLFDGASSNGAFSGVFSTVEQGAVGNGNDVEINAGSLVLTNGARLSTSTLGQGNAGDVKILARDRVWMDGVGSDGFSSGAYSGVARGAVGNGGNVYLSTGGLLLTNGAQLVTSTYGQGNAGKVKIAATDTASFDGVGTFGLSSGAFSRVESTGVGKSGGIEITTGSLLLTNGAVLSASTLGQGDAGSLLIQANESVSLNNNSTIFSTVESGAVGNGGDINITASSLALTNGSTLQTLIRQGFGTLLPGRGNAGNVNIVVRDAVTLAGVSKGVTSGIGTLVDVGATGKGGDINLNAGSLSLSDGANLNANIFGNGNAGNINIDVRDTIAINGFNIFTFNGVNYLSSSGITSGVGLGGTGNAGDIKIKAGSLLLADTAGIVTNTAGQGNAGNIFIQTDDAISVTNLSEIRTVVEPGGVGKGGDIDIQARTLSLTNGSQVNAALFRTMGSLPGGQGRGGDIRINASDSVNIAGVSSFQLPVSVINPWDPSVNLPTEGFSSGLFTSTERGASGQGGDISVQTRAFRVADGAVVNAQTLNPSNGGNITINTNTFEAAGGGQVLTLTRSSGRAGNITLNATDKVTLSGSDPSFADRFARYGRDVVNNEGSASGLFASATNASGQAGDLRITTGKLTVRDGAQVTVSSRQGQAGNLNITANSLTLNRGTISAETAKSGSEGGANITLKGLDLLRMDNESLISATALQDANGGNVTIDSTFIVAIPPKGPEGSDIIANADRGNGGQVNITTQGLFGIKFRPRRTPQNDITASSNFGVAGVVQVNGPTVDPSRGLGELPTNFVDASKQIDRRCSSGSTQRNSFTITGRGGIPQGPNDVLQGESVITPDWVTTDSEKENNTPPTPTTPTNSAPKQLVEANGWYINEQGQVVLTASAPNVTPHGEAVPQPECNPYQSENKP